MFSCEQAKDAVGAAQQKAGEVYTSAKDTLTGTVRRLPSGRNLVWLMAPFQHVCSGKHCGKNCVAPLLIHAMGSGLVCWLWSP